MEVVVEGRETPKMFLAMLPIQLCQTSLGVSLKARVVSGGLERRVMSAKLD